MPVNNPKLIASNKKFLFNSASLYYFKRFCFGKLLYFRAEWVGGKSGFSLNTIIQKIN